MRSLNKIEKDIILPLLKGGKIHIPEYVNQVKIDVGLSHTAVNSLLWINNPNLSDRYVFGFEPNPKLEPYRNVSSDRYKLIRCGVGDVPEGGVLSFPHLPT